ncbi:MAG: putative lipid II flippase FtsW [Rhizobiaceae bacterium]|jgi:cell division protein FtsW|nr:putative lipid II flippase FtsW [Rhizobiaceae bacterium]
MVSRADKSLLAEWWRTVDKPLLTAFLLLMLFGLLMSFAGSPPVAERIGLDEFHFIKRHMIFLVPALAIFLICSMLTPQQVRRAAFLLFAISIIMLIATLFVGSEAKGSRRWIYLAGFTLQPSEFVKPAFAVITAWLFAENSRRPDIPGSLFSIILLGIVCALLIVQPDFGQTMLIAAVWGVLFFMAGMSWLWIAALGSIAVTGMISAYVFFDHVAARINRFLTGEGDNFQVNTGLEAIINGGWLGQGPGEGTVKKTLPDSHTDFSFAVAAEEFGIIACMLLVGLFAFVVLRGLHKSLEEKDAYVRMASSGLVLLFGFQSIINIGVNLKLLPAKGMTLPFISYGGSSMLAMAIGMGFLLALTRSRPESRQSPVIGFNLQSVYSLK